MGYYEQHEAVEFYKGSWILRARLPGDKPMHECKEAEFAMSQWKRRNRERSHG